jgi:putative FmdB family regulatory protein
MPLYEYQCDACGQRFEMIQKFSDGSPDACRLCGKGPVQRLLSSPAIQFKGTGWYITDYSQKGKAPSGGDGAPSTANSDSKSDSKGDSKGDSKSSDSTSSKSDSSSSSTPASSTPATPSKTE